MKKVYKSINKIFLLLLTLFPLTTSCQNYFGIWEGINEPSPGWAQPQKVVLELYKENDTTIIGASHLYYKRNKYEHYTLKGKINLIDKSIELTEVNVLSIKLGLFAKSISGTYYLKLYCFGNSCSLKGIWKPKRINLLAAQSVNTYFRRSATENDTAKSSFNPTKHDKNISKALDRKPNIQSLIEIDSKKADSININIYDNGDIDQDSISLYLDDIVIIEKQQISANPITLSIPTSKLKPISRLKLIAENLGTIPPCTATMVIYIGKKRYEINLSSDLDNNGIIELFLE